MNDQPVSLAPLPQGYADWLAELKNRIHSAQQRTTLAVNRELVLLYWQIGRDILIRQAARESLKDPYLFNFLDVGKEADEHEIESALVKHITQFLLELGAGFAFVGRQVHLEVGGDDFFIDLLFYHLKLRCYVVIELKADKFKPEHLGQLGFYLTAVDWQVKSEQDAPSIEQIEHELEGKA